MSHFLDKHVRWKYFYVQNSKQQGATLYECSTPMSYIHVLINPPMSYIHVLINPPMSYIHVLINPPMSYIHVLINPPRSYMY